jgi:hypothetical protein
MRVSKNNRIGTRYQANLHTLGPQKQQAERSASPDIAVPMRT